MLSKSDNFLSKTLLLELIKSVAYEAYHQACDENRCDRWADDFDENMKADFEEFWKKELEGIALKEIADALEK